MTTILATVNGRPVTDEDALWLGRAMEGEAGSNALEAHACASVLLRRWAQRGGASFTEHIRAFSQPVNPRWAAGGDLALRNPSSATAAQLERRARVTALGWLQLSASARDAVAAVLGGRLLLPGAIDWGGPTLYRPHGLDTSSVARRIATAPLAVQRREGARGRPSPRYEHLSGASAGGNVFSSDATSRAAAEPVVEPAGGPLAKPLPIALALGALFLVIGIS